MKKRLTMVVLVLCLAMSLLACGGKTGEDTAGKQPQMTWQEQYDLGIRLLNEGNYEEAILAFQAAIQIDPKRVDAYVAMADAYVFSGDRDGAMAALQSALNNGVDAEGMKAQADRLGYYIGEDGRVYPLAQEGPDTENETTQSEDESIAESLAALPVEDQLRYYTDRACEDWQWCFEDNIQIFGHDVRAITLEQLRAEALQRGWSSKYDIGIRHDGTWCTHLNSGGRGLIAGQLQDDAQGIVGFTYLQVGYGPIWYATRDQSDYQMAPGTDTGILNLQMGDSLETVLIKLGVPNAEQIAATALLWTATEEEHVTYVAKRDIFKFAPDYDSIADGMKDQESIRLSYTNVGTPTNGHIQDSIQLVYRVFYKNVDKDPKLTLFFYGPEYELWYYEIINQYE